MSATYKLIKPVSPEVPVVVSVPHCGTAFPDEIKDQFKKELIAFPDDTDWFVENLYDFVTSLGIAVIYAHYSRWVIDLNRDPERKPLYSDGRIITGLCPTTTFLGEPLYNDRRSEIVPDEISRRLELFYRPYHRQIQTMLDDLKQRFGKVLLWDCHSIRQQVPTIHKEKFPDLILGDIDGTSASPGLIEQALSVLEHSHYTARHNYLFKGGFITRHFGKPSEHQHALQLEMAKVNYMDDSETRYDKARADKMKGVLIRVFEKLIDELIN